MKGPDYERSQEIIRVREKGAWTGSWDVVLFRGGTCGSTKPQTTREDALPSAAYGIVRHCDAILSANGTIARDLRRAARELMRWLARLDLL